VRPPPAARKLDVVGDELDVGLHLDVPSDGSVVARKLLSSRRVVCASPDYVSRHGAPDKPDDLLMHDCIRLVRGRHVFDRWIFREGGQLREVQVQSSAFVYEGFRLSLEPYV